MAVEITSATTTVSVGEKVTVGIKYTKEWGVLKSVSWTIPGKIIKNYTANFVEGKVDPYVAPASTKFTNEFFWVDGGDGRSVDADCVFTSGGKDTNKKVSATFDVKRPKVDQYDSVLGAVKVQSNRLGLFGPGITWTAKVSPNGARDGLIALLQLINPHRVWDPGKKFTSSGVFVLDGAAGKSKIFYAQKTEALAGSQATLTSNDSPSHSLDLFPNALKSTGEDKFKIWLMYQSSESGSLWVPLSALTWDWNGEAKRATTSAAWALQGTGSKSAQASADTTDFPEWTKYFPNLGLT